MYPVSARWDSAVRSSHEVVSHAEVWRNGVYTGLDLGITGGEVRLDESSKVRRTLSLTSADVDLMPDDLAATLSPVDTDLKVYSGIRFTEGDVELVPLGVFRLETPKREGLASELAIEGADYSSVLAAARFVAPWNVARDTPIVDAIAAMVRDVLPWVDVIDLTGSDAVSYGQAFERDRWDAIETLAAGIGAEAAFDADGSLVIRPTPVVDESAVVWEVDSETETAVLLDAGLALSASGVYNAVVATSSDTDRPPVTATVYQSTGPLRYRDGFKRPRFYSSPLLRSVDDCVRAARSILVRSLTASQQITPTVAPNPALDIGDTIAIALPGREPVYRVLSKAEVPLGPGPMSLEVRVEVETEEEGLE